MAKKRRNQKSAWKTPVYVDCQGQVLCRHCKQPIRPPRRTFCSDACVVEWKIRTNATFAREMVFRRDKGFCCFCGLDTEYLRRTMCRLTEEAEIQRKKDLGIPLHRDTFWDADHIVAVKDGGGECGLDNLRTLCIFCHIKRTIDQRKT